MSGARRSRPTPTLRGPHPQQFHCGDHPPGGFAAPRGYAPEPGEAPAASRHQRQISTCDRALPAFRAIASRLPALGIRSWQRLLIVTGGISSTLGPRAVNQRPVNNLVTRCHEKSHSESDPQQKSPAQGRAFATQIRLVQALQGTQTSRPRAEPNSHSAAVTGTIGAVPAVKKIFL